MRRGQGKRGWTGWVDAGCCWLAVVLSLFGVRSQAQAFVSGGLGGVSVSPSGVSRSNLAETDAEGASGVSGVVTDTSEAAVPGARVTLEGESSAAVRSLVSEEDGRFAFAGVPAGAYRVRVERAGFQSWKGTATLVHGQSLALGGIALTIAAAEAVEVRASARDVAEAQVQLAEQQRVLGVFPNFYASYVSDAEPLGAGQKFRLAWRFSNDPVALMMTGVVAGSEQKADSFAGYGGGSSGYAKRFGAAYADGLTSTMLGQALLPAVLHQDPRYFVKGTGSVGARVLYALASTVMCKGDNRRWQVNYSNVLGNVASAGISNAYYPAGSRGLGLVIENSMTATAMGAVGGLFQEFLLHRMTPHVPAYGEVR